MRLAISGRQEWRVASLKRVARFQSGDAISAEEISDQGPYPVLGGNGLRGFTSAYNRTGPHALVGRQGALCGNVNWADGRYWATEHAIVVSPADGVEIRWLRWVLEAMDLGRYSMSAAQPGLSVEVIENLRLPVPTAHEQRWIADYLDHEVNALLDLLEMKQRLVRLLQEQIDAAVMQHVGQSRLVRRDSRMDAVPLRRVLAKLNRRPEPGGEVVTAFRDGQVTTRAVRRADGFTESWSDGAQVQGVCLDDVVVHGLDGFAGAIGSSEASGVCSPIYHVCTPVGGGDPQFYGELLRLLATTGYLGSFATSTRERAVDFRNWDAFGRIPVPVVPLAEQHRIGQLIRRLRPFREHVNRSQGLILEKRQALISVAVTGQLEISGVAA